MLSVDAARAAILDGVRPTPAETVAIEAARGRVLAEPVVATRAQPPFATSSMDGYAFRIGRTRYRVVGTARAAKPMSARSRPTRRSASSRARLFPTASTESCRRSARAATATR